MTVDRAAIVTLGRARGMGEGRRVGSWQEILRSAGFESTVVRLRSECSSSARRWPDPWAAAAGRTPPETLSWSPGSAERRLVEIDPSVTVFVTLRAFHPRLVQAARNPILDLVDKLSTSYRDRATLVDALPRRWMFGVLGAAMGRAEHNVPRSVRTTAAGRADALALGAHWIPNVVEVPPLSTTDPDHDLVFFGNLAYPPNVAAVQVLANWWPELQRQRPGTTLLVAGRNPDPRVHAAAAAIGATLEDSYPDASTVARRGRIAVAPLAHTAGIQNKVIEAAAAGVAQVVSVGALAGLPEQFPARRADDASGFAREVTALIEQPELRSELARRARVVAETTFCAASYRAWVLQGLT
jgi:hypothetical protein